MIVALRLSQAEHVRELESAVEAATSAVVTQFTTAEAVRAEALARSTDLEREAAVTAVSSALQSLLREAQGMAQEDAAAQVLRASSTAAALHDQQLQTLR